MSNFKKCGGLNLPNSYKTFADNEYGEVVMGSNILPQIRLVSAIKNRKIFIDRMITDDLITECIYYLDKIVSLDAIAGEKQPIELHISTNGGDVYAGNRLINRIEQLKKTGYEIITYNDSIAYSMGFMIALVGSKRITYEHSYYMFHDISTGTFDKVQNIIEDMEHWNILRADAQKLVTKYTKLTQEEIETCLYRKQDLYFDAQTALNKAICDEII